MKTEALIVLLFAWVIISPSILEAKQADFDGSWYPEDPKVLKRDIDKYLGDASVEKIEGEIIGAIVPHAGYEYSGSIAAYAFKALKQKNPDTVIIVGFTHRRFFEKSAAVFTDEAFYTPLGKAEIDMDLTKRLLVFDKNIKDIPVAFSEENSVEMEVPFSQATLEGAKFVLIAVSDQSMDTSRILANALYHVLKDRDNYVILASTDLCHYRSYSEANRMDKETIKKIEKFDPESFYLYSLKSNHEAMCGPGAVYAVMLASKKLGADEVKILKYANSGDTSGMKNRVVGYVSVLFVKSAQKKTSLTNKGEGEMFNKDQKEKLLKIARDSISHYLKTGKKLDVEVDDEALKENMGAFVTLHKNGELRGCIGHMEAAEPLYLTVRNMAIAAAVEDYRFSTVTQSELDDIDIEISVLSPMERIEDPNIIEMGKHGVKVRMGWRGGVYLPQVATETGWTREEFMNSLCAHKSGIPMDAWKTGECDIYIFTAEVFGEKDLKAE